MRNFYLSTRQRRPNEREVNRDIQRVIEKYRETSNELKIDRLSFSLVVGKLRGMSELNSAYRATIGRPLLEPERDTLLGSTPYDGDGSYAIEVKRFSKKTPRNSRAISGRLSAKREKLGDPPEGNDMTTYEGYQEKVTFKGFIHFNPTKMINGRPRLHEDTEEELYEALLDGVNHREQTIQQGLDGNLNVLPDNYRYDDYLNAESQSLRATIECFVNEVHAPSEIDWFDFDYEQDVKAITPSDVEFYWECEVDNAVRLCHHLESSLKLFSNNFTAREYPLDCAHWESSLYMNAKSFLLRLNKNCTIAVYAKKGNRLRIEVRFHNVSKAGLVTGGVKSKSPEGFQQVLNRLRGIARGKLDEVLAAISENMDIEHREIASSAAFARKWYKGVGFSDEAERILDILRLEGRVVRRSALTRKEANLVRRAKETHGLLEILNGNLVPVQP
jgi:hypothetical protein